MASETPVTAKKSNASRYLFLFLLGLVVGAVGTVFAMRAIQARQDPFPHSVMHVMGKQMDLLDATVKSNRCAATDTVPYARTLRAMGNDLEIAFPSLAEDQRFVAHASDFRGKLDAALAAPPTDCAAATAMAKQIGGACKACHQDFRN
ncbi:cytochrome c [Pseudoxanthomonas helianthi]|uniref:Cytochrome c n=1 Tax=Pseudoxanthomonas helianthi TaxID=1453541 RepID=A0A940X3Y3_9GAMM|nr:cytochrome c [Pseudoxanthomonas helianthi]MBP3985494.1 cytochrome c [Pseudoxanthomonas helianthi]